VSYYFSAIEAYIHQLIRGTPLNGASLSIAHRGAVIYEQAFGAYSLDTHVVVASGTKWVSAAVIASLIGDGVLHLEARASDYLIGFDGDKSTITLRQLLAHTSGLPPGEAPCVGDASRSLAACADQIAQVSLIAAPGAAFAYGESAFQVAGRIAEVATGRPWAALFHERIAEPLGMTASDYDAERTGHPRVGSGLRSTLRDYSRFVRMIAAGGVLDGIRVLAPAVVALMHEDHTFGAPVIASPNLFPGSGYGLGVWRDLADEHGRVIQVSSPGASGFTPWVDFRRDLACVFLVRDAYRRMAAPVRELQRLVREAVDVGNLD
jgi:CubicO group peptidase (beta-lactamase class C family)